ncbi:hypothetical protein PE067_08360 [Paracoccus sp. DMF-8]|uniref:spike base protein, RCAP_Rcc01079 family n=1 Tax=Paracoccus sp. DMF-8 TaxID=3019445 RepID=UPI0023E774EF|nr:hypothetical protein [Paracoccus sp. DMF-8]MDF3606139.1 hypothetical protein [Paracoccus sp. DMF-8]
MPNDRFAAHLMGVNGPAIGSFVVTPSDSADLPEVVRAVTIGGGGSLAWRGRDGADYVTAALPAGTYPVSAVRILATGTTATLITGWV